MQFSIDASGFEMHIVTVSTNLSMYRVTVCCGMFLAYHIGRISRRPLPKRASRWELSFTHHGQSFLNQGELLAHFIFGFLRR